MGEESLYNKGLSTMRRLVGEKVVSGFTDPKRNPILEWDKEIISFCFGSVYSRPNLDLKSRALCAIAALTVLGQWDVLEKWLYGVKTVGVTDEEIMEVIFQMAIYGGCPNSRKALIMAKEIFSKRNKESSGSR